jgi:hypothetical protein
VLDESGPSDSSHLASVISQTGPIQQNKICPQFDGREFTTTTWSGDSTRWRIHCNTFVQNPLYIDKWCDGGSVVQILRQRQENRQYRGLFWNSVAVCHDVLPHYTTGWEGYNTSPKDGHAYIERMDFQPQVISRGIVTACRKKWVSTCWRLVP